MAGITADWTAPDSDDNAASAATKAGIAGQRHVVTTITASYSADPAANKLLELKDGTTVVWSMQMKAPTHVVFPKGIRISTGAAAVGALAASGTGGVTGHVTITGYTE